MTGTHDHDSERALVSVVSPVYDEEAGIGEFVRRTRAALDSIDGIHWELVLVDDGSRDASLSRLRRLAAEDERIRVIALSRNFGHQLAITAGIDAADGDAVVVIDSDLQDPPELIREFVAAWREGYRVVYGQRARREGESRFKLWTAKTYYRLLGRLSEVEIPLDAGDFRLLDRSVVDVLAQIREENRYIRGLISWVGFEQKAIPYERDSRHAGGTKYTLMKMLRLAANGITSFSDRPLYLAVQAGLLITLLTFAVGTYIIISKLLNPEGSIPGYASLMAAVLFVGGIQLLTIGILGQYVGRTYRETRRRPLYVVAEETGSRVRSPRRPCPFCSQPIPTDHFPTGPPVGRARAERPGGRPGALRSRVPDGDDADP